MTVSSAPLAGWPALVLNADFRPLSYYPLSLWPWQEVVKAVFLERVDVVAHYDQGTRIADTDSNRRDLGDGQIGERLRGKLILEVPFQLAAVPHAVVAEADALGIVVRDELGHVHELDRLAVRRPRAPPSGLPVRPLRADGLTYAGPLAPTQTTMSGRTKVMKFRAGDRTLVIKHPDTEERLIASLATAAVYRVAGIPSARTWAA